MFDKVKKTSTVEGMTDIAIQALTGVHINTTFVSDTGIFYYVNEAGIPTPITFDVGNYIYVSTNGSNITGEKGNLTKPYRDPWAAMAAATSGDLVYVFAGTWAYGFLGQEATQGYPGTFDITVDGTDPSAASLWKAGVDMYFDPGSKIYGFNEDVAGVQIIVPLWYCDSAGTQAIRGYGTFEQYYGQISSRINTGTTWGTASALIKSVHDDANFIIEADKLEAGAYTFDLQNIQSLVVNVKNVELGDIQLINMQSAVEVVRAVPSNIVIRIDNLTHSLSAAEVTGISMLGAGGWPAWDYRYARQFGGGLGVVEGGYRNISIDIGNWYSEQGSWGTGFSWQTANELKVDINIGNIEWVDAYDIHGGPAMTSGTTFDDMTSGGVFKMSGAGNVESDNVQVNIKVGNYRGPQSAVQLGEIYKRNSVVNVEFGSAISLYKPSIYFRYIGVINQFFTGDQHKIYIKGEFVSENGECILTSSDANYSIPPNEFYQYTFSGRYETKLPATPVVNIASPNNNVMADATPYNAGAFIFENATLVATGTNSIVSTNAHDAIIYSAYSNLPIDANVTEKVGSVVVDGTYIK